MGIDISLSGSSSDSDVQNSPPSPSAVTGLLDMATLVHVLETAKYNWFQVLEYVQASHGSTESRHITEYLKDMYSDFGQC